MALISIIVPVYNTEQYLKTCLDSLINQTFSDIECCYWWDRSSFTYGLTEKYCCKVNEIVS